MRQFISKREFDVRLVLKSCIGVRRKVQWSAWDETLLTHGIENII